MQNRISHWLVSFCILFCSLSALALAVPRVASAMTSEQLAERLGKLEQQTAEAKSSADNAWMLTSSALVLMMTGPGLALFYGGLVRKKNVLSTMVQSFAMMAVISVMWADLRIQSCLWPGDYVHRKFSPFILARGRPGGRLGLLCHDPATNLHGLSIDVCHHNAGLDHGSLCRAHEI